MKNTARQQEAMKQQTIGVEVEMNNQHPERRSRQARSRLLRNRKIQEHRSRQRILLLERMGR